jgi:hypothetical protein
MKLSGHFLKLQSAPNQRDGETVGVARRKDLQWNDAVFRAPALPTPRQIYSEIPFTVNFRRNQHVRR